MQHGNEDVPHMGDLAVRLWSKWRNEDWKVKLGIGGGERRKWLITIVY